MGQHLWKRFAQNMAHRETILKVCTIYWSSNWGALLKNNLKRQYIPFYGADEGFIHPYYLLGTLLWTIRSSKLTFRGQFLLWSALKNCLYFVGGPKHEPSLQINILGAVDGADLKIGRPIGANHLMNYP